MQQWGRNAQIERLPLGNFNFYWETILRSKLMFPFLCGYREQSQVL